MVTRKQIAPVARTPQDPNPPTKCLCLDRKEVKAGKVGYRIAPVGNRRGKKESSSDRNTLSPQTWLGKFCCLKLQPCVFAHHPSQSPDPKYSSFLSSRRNGPHTGDPSGCLCSTWKRKGPVCFPAAKSVRANAVCFCVRDRTVNEPNLVQRRPLELKNNLTQ